MSPKDGGKAVCMHLCGPYELTIKVASFVDNGLQTHRQAEAFITFLPPELMGLILFLLPHVDDLRRTLRASPLFVVGYIGAERLILTKMLYNSIGQRAPERSIEELVDNTLRLGHQNGILERLIDAEGWTDTF